MPPPKPSRRPNTVGVLAALAGAVVIVVGVVVLLQPARPAALAPLAPSASTARRPAPTPSPTPAGADTTLKTNSLYRVDLDRSAAACRLKVRSPKPPLKNSALAPYLRDVADCLVETFAEPLAEEGITLTTPKIKTYAKTISTPCGTYGQNKAPAFYWSVTQTIYWPQTGDDDAEAYTFARLGYVALLAHEFGHHLQHVTGMLGGYTNAYYATKKRNTRDLLSRRLELQAQCFEGVFLNAATKSLRVTATDRAQLQAWHGYTGDEDPPKGRRPDHGTSAAQNHWLRRGLDSGDFGRCNTWKAGKKAVT